METSFCNHHWRRITGSWGLRHFLQNFWKGPKSHISHYLHQQQKVIPKSQHGFVPGRSVKTNMLECINDWSNCWDMEEACDVVYFDCSKAFDRLRHSKLLQRMSQPGVHPAIYNWLRESLANRTSRVKVGKALSDADRLRVAFRAGAFPLLFLI